VPETRRADLEDASRASAAADDGAQPWEWPQHVETSDVTRSNVQAAAAEVEDGDGR